MASVDALQQFLQRRLSKPGAKTLVSKELVAAAVALVRDPDLAVQHAGMLASQKARTPVQQSFAIAL